MLHEELTDQILKAYFAVYNKLGYGFLERVYQNSMMIELKKVGLDCERQSPISVSYDQKLVGDYFADIIVENLVILELKAAERIIEEHETQLLNYLKSTEVEIGLLLNFGKAPEFKRKIFTNDKKAFRKDP